MAANMRTVRSTHNISVLPLFSPIYRTELTNQIELCDVYIRLLTHSVTEQLILKIAKLRCK